LDGFICRISTQSVSIDWSKWEKQAHIYHTPLSPEMRRLQDTTILEMQKKNNIWKLQAHFSFLDEKRKIKHAKEKHDHLIHQQQKQLELKKEFVNDLIWKKKNN